MVSAGERDFCSALEEMTRVEVAAREARIVRQRIRSSGFPYVKGLADFDWDFQPSVPRARGSGLSSLSISTTRGSSSTTTGACMWCTARVRSTSPN
jgi:hypothetical protein